MMSIKGEEVVAPVENSGDVESAVKRVPSAGKQIWAVLYFGEVVAAYVDKRTALEQCVEIENEIVRATIILPKNATRLSTKESSPQSAKGEQTPTVS